MAKKKVSGGKPRGSSRPWPAAKVLQVFNSGLDVWIYDEANIDAIVQSGAMVDLTSEALAPLFKAGLLATYALYQDDELRVAVIVGPPPDEKDLARGAWLEPQTTYLRLPSGRLCIDSADTSQIGPDVSGEEGARVSVPPGDYRLTLYRVDYEALQRMERSWKGPNEVIVLTPGGQPEDAASDILPFALRRDTTWVGRYTIKGNTFQGLAWFDDSWDTFIVNIDERAIGQLGLTPGSCFRTTVGDANVTLVSAFADSWKEARDLAPPSGIPLDEYGFATLVPFQEWNGAQALYCRRDRTQTAIEDAHKKLWLPATVEVLSGRAEKPSRVRGPLIHDAGARAFWQAELKNRHYYNDLQLLTARLMGRVEGVPWGELLPLPRAIQMVDEAMAPLGLHSLGDFSFDVASPNGPVEYTNRLYGGLPDTFAAIWGSRDTFEVFFFSRFSAGDWVLTGTVSKTLAELISQRKGLSVRSGSGRLSAILDTHRAHVADSKAAAIPAPGTLADAVVVYEDYLKTALD